MKNSKRIKKKKKNRNKNNKKISNNKTDKNTNLLTPYQYTLSHFLQTLKDMCRKKIHKY